jgi:hypothetical protein
MLMIECRGCGTQVFTEQHADPDAQLTCPPDSDCCQENHHHGQAASACKGAHGACPTPDQCLVWLGMQPHLEDSNQRDRAAGPCPGGHCGPGVPDCTVCRPLRITVLPGSVSLSQVKPLAN